MFKMQIWSQADNSKYRKNVATEWEYVPSLVNGF